MKKYAALFLFFLIALLPLSVQASDFPFTDVEKTAWYYNDVKTAWESGLINGSTPTEFAPDDNLTWAESVKLAACMHQLHTEGKVTLTAGDPWYQPYMDYALENEIIQYQNAFDPEAPINRGRFIEIFAKALPDDALPPINQIPDGIIDDVPMSHLNSEAIYKLYRAGVIQGSGESHSFYPSRYITRGETAAILTRMMNADTRLPFTIELSENTEYKNAYAEFLRKTGEGEENYVFDLIYVNSDDIPELIIADKAGTARENGVTVYQYTPQEILSVGTYGGYGTITYLPHSGQLLYSVTAGNTEQWISEYALLTLGNPAVTILSVMEVVNHQTQTMEYRMFQYGDTEYTVLTKEEYDAQYAALQEFADTEAVSVTSQRMYDLNEENITKLLG